METRQIIQNRIEQYRSLVRATLDRAAQEVLEKQIEADVVRLDRLNRVETERNRNRVLATLPGHNPHG